MKETDYDLIRPYKNEEIPDALKRITGDPLFNQLLNYLFPATQHASLRNTVANARTRYEFQKDFMYRVIESILENTAEHLTFSGFDKLDKNKGYVFIANHRDIILDSSFLAMGLMKNGINTCEITWGDNLMISPFLYSFF